MTAPTQPRPDGERDDFVRRLVASGIALLMLVVLPLGLWWSTSRSSARFADSEVFDANQLGAATLELQFDPEDVSFQADNLAPGDRVSGHLDLTNGGSLPMAYSISARAVEDGILADWLEFHLWSTSGTCGPFPVGTLPEISELIVDTEASVFLEDGPIARSAGIDPRLDPEESVTICLGADLPLSAPNGVQGKRLELELVIDAVHDVARSEELRAEGNGGS